MILLVAADLITLVSSFGSLRISPTNGLTGRASVAQLAKKAAALPILAI
jgi:hypothetical protein